MIYLDYKDTIKIVDPVIDSYGAEKIGQIEEVDCLFIQITGWEHSNNQDGITSDAEIYIDPEHWFIKANFYRLEDMLVIANPFGEAEADAWYRIINVTVGQDKLLSNGVDNIRLELKKTTELKYVS